MVVVSGGCGIGDRISGFAAGCGAVGGDCGGVDLADADLVADGDAGGAVLDAIADLFGSEDLSAATAGGVERRGVGGCDHWQRIGFASADCGGLAGAGRVVGGCNVHSGIGDGAGGFD